LRRRISLHHPNALHNSLGRGEDGDDTLYYDLLDAVDGLVFSNITYWFAPKVVEGPFAGYAVSC
jgi:hypothetical protein